MCSLGGRCRWKQRVAMPPTFGVITPHCEDIGTIHVYIILDDNDEIHAVMSRTGEKHSHCSHRGCR